MSMCLQKGFRRWSDKLPGSKYTFFWPSADVLGGNPMFIISANTNRMLRQFRRHHSLWPWLQFCVGQSGCVKNSDPRLQSFNRRALPSRQFQQWNQLTAVTTNVFCLDSTPLVQWIARWIENPDNIFVYTPSSSYRKNPKFQSINTLAIVKIFSMA